MAPQGTHCAPCRTGGASRRDDGFRGFSAPQGAESVASIIGGLGRLQGWCAIAIAAVGAVAGRPGIGIGVSLVGIVIQRRAVGAAAVVALDIGAIAA